MADSDFIVFGRPDIRDEEIAEVVATLESGWLGTGPRVAAFQAEFAAFKGVDADRVVALNSGTAALHLCLLAAGIGPGDEVITTPLTFCATANAILHAGATPVLADVDPETMNIDPAAIRKKLTGRTRALLPVHFAGRPCEMDDILAIAREHGLRVIEDCAHAIESAYRGRPVGTLGDFGAFSFYVTKNVTSGEGGMAIASAAADAARIGRLSLHGLSRDAWQRYSGSGFRHYQVLECGYKYNMMDLQAAIGVHQLRRVDSGLERRRAIWARYQSAFRDLPLTRPAEAPAHMRHAHHLYPLLIDADRCGIDRDRFVDALTRRGIGVGIHYLALPDHPYYRQDLGWRPEDTPYATRIGRQTLSLPLYPGLDDGQVDRVIDAVRQVAGREGG